MIPCYLVLLITSLPSGSDYQERNWLQDNKNKSLSTDSVHQENSMSVIPTWTQLTLNCRVDRSHLYHMSWFCSFSCFLGMLLKYKFSLKHLSSVRKPLEAMYIALLGYSVASWKWGKAQQRICYIYSNWKYITIFNDWWGEITLSVF